MLTYYVKFYVRIFNVTLTFKIVSVILRKVGTYYFVLIFGKYLSVYYTQIITLQEYRLKNKFLIKNYTFKLLTMRSYNTDCSILFHYIGHTAV